jgi:hypothetical protein
VREQLDNPVNGRGQADRRREGKVGRPPKNFDPFEQPTHEAEEMAVARAQQVRDAQIAFEIAEAAFLAASTERATIFHQATECDKDSGFRGVSIPAIAELLAAHGLTVRKIQDDIKIYVKGTGAAKYRRKPRQ